ncbi:GNAT family N-acetyltransferase [Clostridium folliculivorans]|uniref:N-acetyltransferase n=1 Tax=Clostridium folliculivorans TaxID=2886038 RepID=A0A9W6DCI1_9CLOT|nr:GNAT family protein [Clostridium folliculivorans]GKU27031.1 N-acetyltransferase [Clostridium folliculivorans]GKU29127.1 N-acetyltransferase [Clostridium folliculivorans]
MVSVSLRDVKEIVIREAKKEDAKSIIDFYNVVGGETDFLSFGKNEFIRDLKDYENYLESVYKEENSIIFLATIEDEIIGIASINSNQKARTKHVGVLGIVVAKDFCGLGLGSKIIEHLIKWAKENKVTKKISLVTREDNSNAIKLYEKFGFEVEGILKADNYINGVYYNTLMMSLII